MSPAPRRARALAPGVLVLGTLLGLAACGERGAGQPGAGDPYAGGVSYPWTGVGAPTAGGLKTAAITADTFLSDATWDSASNAWGPIEKDRSNGDKLAGDGKALTIGGQTFAKGLGTHAGSAVSYTLGGTCSTFTATLGVDDEVGDRGSVVFEVWNGTTDKLYDSGVLRGTDAPRSISVPVGGVSTLRLVVRDAGDGINYDHADWGNARLSCTSSPPPPASSQGSLSNLPWSNPTNAWGPIEKNSSVGGKALGDGKPLTIGGQTFARGLGMHAGASVSYALGGRCSAFSASVGVDDAVGSAGSVAFQVFGDGTLLAGSGVRRGTDGPTALNASLSGVNELRLVVTDAGDGNTSDHADWGDASVTCTPGPTPPATPEGFTASGSSAGITLDWGDMLGAGLGGYRLERALTPGGLFQPVTPDLIGTSGFTDPFAPEGRTSHYRVATLDPGGSVSGVATVSAARPAAPPTSSLTYSPMADQPQGVSEAQGRAVNGKVYTFGGFDRLKSCCTPTDRAYVYEPAVNLWRRLPNMPGRGVTHAGMTTDGTSIYYAGGYIANSTWTAQVFGTKAVWRFDLASETYTRLPDLPVERAAGQLEYLNGRLHYFGGTNLARTRDVGDHYVLDLTSGATSWVTAAPLPNPRHHMGSAVLNGRVYAIGGQHGHDSQLVTQATLNAYNPATDTWVTLRDLPSARSHISSAAFVLGGRIVVAGGERSHLQNISAVNAYDPATDTWAVLTPLPTTRASGVAAPLGNGFIYSAGNGSRSGWRVLPSGTP